MKDLLLAGMFFGLSVGLISWAVPVEGAPISFEPDWSQCVKVMDAGTTVNSQSQIKFYNGCPERLYMNACVTATDGEKKLYQSGSRISTNGTWSIMTFPHMVPAKLHWTAGRTQVDIPSSC